MSVSSRGVRLRTAPFEMIDDEEIGLRVGLHGRRVRGAVKRDEPPVGRRRELRGGAVDGRDDPRRTAAGVDGVEQRLRGREVGLFDVASAEEERAAVGGVGRLQLADPRAVELASRRRARARCATGDEIDAAVARPVTVSGAIRAERRARDDSHVARLRASWIRGHRLPAAPSSRRPVWRCPDSTRIPRRPPGCRVSGRESPPDRSSANTCGGSAWPPLSSPARMNASIVPFGDHRGDVSRGPAVSDRGWNEPSVEISQIALA